MGYFSPSSGITAFASAAVPTSLLATVGATAGPVFARGGLTFVGIRQSSSGLSNEVTRKGSKEEAKAKYGKEFETAIWCILAYKTCCVPAKASFVYIIPVGGHIN